MNWNKIYILAALISIVISFFFTWICRKLAFSWGFVDKPLGEQHKRHSKPMPVLGGLAISTSWIITVLAGIVFSSVLRNYLGSDISSQIEGIKHVWNQLLIIFLGATALVFVGMYDDRAPIGPLPKFAAQFWVAGATACWGVRITLFWNIPVFTWIVTTLWIMLIINAINFFDNMDGLTAGTSAIASFLFFFVASVNHQYFVATLSAITFGSTLGFWFHNRYPAKIYMGDAGSHFLGYMLAVIGALTTFHSKETPTPFAVLIPLCILLLPIFDLLLVMGIRKKIGKPIYRGDHNHISHRFHKMGLSKTNSVRCVHLLSLALGLGVLPMMWLGFKGILVILLQFSAIFAFIIIISTVHIRDIIEDE